MSVVADPTITHIENKYNSAYDSGFQVVSDNYAWGSFWLLRGSGIWWKLSLSDWFNVSYTPGAYNFSTGTRSEGKAVYTAKYGVFTGGETCYVTFNQSDNSGNTSNTVRLDLNKIDTSPPSAPTISHVANNNNSLFDSGFFVNASSITTKINGVSVITENYFTENIGSSGLKTYTAKSGAFSGSEVVSVSATNIDAAGNTNSATLTLLPIDTTSPAAPVFTTATYTSSQWYIAGTAEKNSSISIYDGNIKLATFAASTLGKWSYNTGQNNNDAHTYTVVSTDAAGNSTSSIKLIEGTNGSDTVVIVSEQNSGPVLLGSGNNEVIIYGDGNTVDLGSGTNFVSVSGSGTNTIEAAGSFILKIDNLSSMTHVDNWDNARDQIILGSSVNLSQISIVFNSAQGVYRVFSPENKMIAELTPSTVSLPTFNGTNQSWGGINIYPISINAADPKTFIASLFAEALDRSVDTTSLDLWLEALKNGMSRLSVVATIFKSPEYTSSHSSDTEFLKSIYHDLLGRTIDEAAQEYWLDQFALGLSHSVVVDTILTGHEFSNLLGLSHPVIIGHHH